jgi:hypothetical protein
MGQRGFGAPSDPDNASGRFWYHAGRYDQIVEDSEKIVAANGPPTRLFGPGEVPAPPASIEVSETIAALFLMVLLVLSVLAFFGVLALSNPSGCP